MKSKPTRAEKFKLFNDRIRILRADHARAISTGDGRGVRDSVREIRKLRGRIAALPRIGDQQRAPGQGISYTAKILGVGR